MPRRCLVGLLALMSASLIDADVGGKTLFFGKMRWGQVASILHLGVLSCLTHLPQDKTYVFLTIFCPGVDTSNHETLLRIDNDTFKFEAVDPQTSKPNTVHCALESMAPCLPA